MISAIETFGAAYVAARGACSTDQRRGQLRAAVIRRLKAIGVGDLVRGPEPTVQPACSGDMPGKHYSGASDFSTAVNAIVA